MIASLQNPLVKHLVRLREDKQYRQVAGSVLITGSKMIKEIGARLSPKRLFFTDYPSENFNCETFQVSEQVLKKITGLAAPESPAAEFPLPSPTSLKGKAPLLALDAVRDPGNLGTLLRTALSFGWEGVFFLPTCVDPFNDKVIRASRGALFYLPWQQGSWDELSLLTKEENLIPYVADTEGEPLASIKKERGLLLVLSNEGSGVCLEGERFGKKITIPMEGVMESLNVAIAGSILLYTLRP